MPKRWNEEENNFTVELFCLQTGLVKQHRWRLISYDHVGAEQVLGALNAYEKGILREYHYRLFKCLESSQRTTHAELGALLSKRRG